MTNLFDLKGKTVVIAGSGGLGRGAAVGLAANGADIVFADVNPQNNAAGVKAVAEYGVKTCELSFDIMDRSSIDRMIDEALAFTGRIDILFNAVGISRMGLAEELPFEDWMAVQDAFLNHVFYICQQVAVKAMIPQKYGKIMNVASMSGVVVTGDGASPYCTAKAGVIQLSRALAASWSKHGITVNSISPGYMITALTEKFLSVPGVGDGILPNIPKGRFGQPEDMAGLATFLASDASEYMVGQNFIIDGGYTLR